MIIQQKIFQTDNSWTPLVLRIFLGLVVFPHGAQKLFGWFGGYGFSGTMDFFTDAVGLPWIIGFFVIILESIGAIALVAGVATRLIAIAYAFLAAGIIFSSHFQHGFFMNWFGNQAGEGYEYFLLWIGMAIALFISGGGKFSIDKEIIMTNKAKSYSA
ncbi:DoxX family protein [Marivirga sp. S37H4]|uniref:DoxX family protein n=1 Tax=Marivirga aurantiaca TaxID=2802615 RepID=A0A934X053_9BACT|nr:DoxX family protein [Marivirga aurantiaca]MBK6266076.1 DoxX family protein [Marivirga aurantiaca]